MQVRNRYAMWKKPKEYAQGISAQHIDHFVVR